MGTNTTKRFLFFKSLRCSFHFFWLLLNLFLLLLCWLSLPYLPPCTSAIATKSSLSFLGINHRCHLLCLVNTAWSPLRFTLSLFILPEIHQYIYRDGNIRSEFCHSILLYLEKKSLSTTCTAEKKELIYVAATLLFLPEVSLISTGVRELKIHLRVQHLAAVELLLAGYEIGGIFPSWNAFSLLFHAQGSVKDCYWSSLQITWITDNPLAAHEQ